MFLEARLTTWCTCSNRRGDVFKRPQSRRTKETTRLAEPPTILHPLAGLLDQPWTEDRSVD